MSSAFRKIYLNILISLWLIQAAPVSSAGFTIRESAVGDGGEKSTSSQWMAQSTIGGPVAVGTSTSTRYLLKSGFQYFDETPPDIGGAFLNDGLGEDVDEQTALGEISASWSGIFDPESGLHKEHPFELALRRESDGLAWSPVAELWQESASFFTTSTQITLSRVDLRTDEIYFFELRAFNVLNMKSPLLRSDGVKIISYLAFQLNAAEVSLGELAPGNDFTNQAASIFLVSTNSFYGYEISVQSLGPLAHTALAGQAITDWRGTNGEPLLWDKTCAEDARYCGFGYQTTDTDLGGGRADRFAGGPYFAGFNHIEAKLAADHPGPITGRNGEIKDEKVDVVYRVSVNDEHLPGQYATTIVYAIGAGY